jgi:hypothetical protein
VCLSAVTFYALRRAAKSLGVTCRLRPKDTTAVLLPSRGRRRFWAELQRTAGLAIPQLQRAPGLVWACTGAVVAVNVGVGFAAHRAASVTIVPFASVVAAAASALLLAALTRPLAVHPAKHCRTLRGLAEATLARNFDLLAEKYRGAQADDVWVALRTIIVEQLGVSPDAVTPSATFVKDLGCG